jgi:putative ABC transport system permease protein
MDKSPNLRYQMAPGEAFAVAIDTLRVSRASALLSALGMVVGTSALILVVTIGMTGKEYVLRQINGIGVNWIFAEYQGGAQRITNTAPDPLTINDLKVVLQDVPEIVAASPVLPLRERMPVGRGKERDLQVLGVYPDYERIRNLIILSGRFFDATDLGMRSKVCVITEQLANDSYGSVRAALGQEIKLSGLPFIVIGAFKERVYTFEQSELTRDTIIIPYTVSRFFVENDSVKQLYFSVNTPDTVMTATAHVRRVIQARHRTESVYLVNNLTELITVANKASFALSIVLVLIAAVTLLVGGVGIMNIMLSAVDVRTHEIGIRRAVGATKQAIILQFLVEAMLISLVGGTAGVIIGLGLPLSVRLLTDYRIPISGVSAIIAMTACVFTGLLFGTFPAIRAAQLHPIDSLRHE